MKRLAAVLAVVTHAGCARRLPPRATPADAARANMTVAELDAGRTLVIRKCGGSCHKPPLPDDHSAAEWPQALDEMAPRANVTADERRAIERYLVAMARR